MWPFVRRRVQSLGETGEKLAEKFLRRLGYRILARNYRCPPGEADIIALDKHSNEGQTALVFVEVKSRRSEAAVDAESAIDARKRRQLLNVARYYLSHHPAGDMPVRFDSVAVIAPEQGEPTVRHTPDAFAP
jgi:putative endonuclease